MGRLYVPSTPASRGEAAPDPQPESVEGKPLTLTVAEVTLAAESLGFRLVPIEPDGGQGGGQGGNGPGTSEPDGNASREEWAAYATSKGAPAEETKPKDEGGLGRDALRAKYGTPAGS